MSREITISRNDFYLCARYESNQRILLLLLVYQTVCRVICCMRKDQQDNREPGSMIRVLFLM